MPFEIYQYEPFTWYDLYTYCKGIAIYIKKREGELLPVLVPRKPKPNLQNTVFTKCSTITTKPEIKKAQIFLCYLNLAL